MTQNDSTNSEFSSYDADKIVIRPMTIDDLAPVFHLGEELFTPDRWPALYRTWDEYEVVAFFEGDSETCFVAEGDGRVVGFAMGNVIEKRRSAWKYGYIVWLGVTPALGRHGIGSMLFDAMRDQFIELGVRMILVDTDANNTHAIRFFKKTGFDHENKHVYLSMNLTHCPAYQNYRKKMKDEDEE